MSSRCHGPSEGGLSPVCSPSCLSPSCLSPGVTYPLLFQMEWGLGTRTRVHALYQHSLERGWTAGGPRCSLVLTPQQTRRLDYKCPASLDCTMDIDMPKRGGYKWHARQAPHGTNAPRTVQRGLIVVVLRYIIVQHWWRARMRLAPSTFRRRERLGRPCACGEPVVPHR